MSLERCPECGHLTRVYDDAGHRQHEPGCSRAIVLPPCPECGGVLRLEMKLEAKLVSLAGAQMKLGAREWPYLVCDRCPFEEAGKIS
jgi:ribosomal protein S27E